MKTAVVITSHNQAHFLKLGLRGLVEQTDQDFTVFIADDGSTDGTEDIIQRYNPLLKNGVHRFWQPHQGFQKAKINNEVFRNIGDVDVVICMDADTIPHYKFVHDHKEIHRGLNEGRGTKRVLFMGRRVDLGPDMTASMTEEKVPRLVRGPSWELLQSGMFGDSRNVLRAIRIKPVWLRRLLGRDLVNDLIGSNFSVSRELLFEVNGYNEDFREYWGEDGDLFLRLRNAGAEIVGSKSVAIQFHLHHPRRVGRIESQREYRARLLRPDYRICPNGIRKMTEPMGLGIA